jgi:hypothetical protein
MFVDDDMDLLLIDDCDRSGLLELRLKLLLLDNNWTLESRTCSLPTVSSSLVCRRRTQVEKEEEEENKITIN